MTNNKKDVVNLYTIDNCPKCNLLKNFCSESQFIADSDFKIINIKDDSDTDYHLLREHHILSMPVLLVNNTFYTFAEAIDFLRKQDNKNERNSNI